MENIYKQWEKSVIEHFYNKSKSTSLKLPKDNSPLYAYKNKVILVLNFITNDAPISEKVEKGNKDLPKKEYINLYHIGEKKINKTSSGLKDNDFFYPAIDTGGLTNYKQQLGTKPKFLEKKFLIDNNVKKVSQKTINEIYKTWKLYSDKKRFYGNLKKELSKAIHSIDKDCFLQFVKLPLEYRVTATSKNVYNKTKHYYNRLYGNDNYAKEVKPRKGMYCGIGEKFITPDINKNNILNEYTI